MKRPLPESYAKVIALFPSNLRFITEHSFSEIRARNLKIFLVSVFSLFLLVIIFLQSVTLWYNLREEQAFTQQRAKVQQEVLYWEGIAEKYKGYRDVYYRIATLQYKLGNVQEAQSYVKKALELDPNFPQGQVLGARIGL